MPSYKPFRTNRASRIIIPLDDAPAPKYKSKRIPGPDPDGGERMYDSIKEMRHAESLMWRMKAGDIKSWEPQARIKLQVNEKPLMPFQGKRASVYVADFLVVNNDQTREIHEVKGYVNPQDPVTRLWMLKLGIVQLMWPDVKVVIV